MAEHALILKNTRGAGPGLWLLPARFHSGRLTCDAARAEHCFCVLSVALRTPSAHVLTLVSRLKYPAVNQPRIYFHSFE